MVCSFFHKLKRPLNSISASWYRWNEHPFLIIKIMSYEPFTWRLWRRKNSRIYRFIRFRKAAGPISFFTTTPNLWKLLSVSLTKRIRLREEVLLPNFITFLNSWGCVIRSFFENLKDSSTAILIIACRRADLPSVSVNSESRPSTFFSPWSASVSIHFARSWCSSAPRNHAFSSVWDYWVDMFSSSNPSLFGWLIFWND